MEDADCDHVLALDEGGTNSPTNFQLLCRTPCHQEKSNDEASRASFDTLESRFSSAFCSRAAALLVALTLVNEIVISAKFTWTGLEVRG